jgi:hypothetical protein
MTRAIYTGDCDDPAPGSKGTVQPANGFNDPQSAEFGAWSFTPDGKPGEAAQVSYYIAEEDFEPLVTARVFGHFDLEVRASLDSEKRTAIIQAAIDSAQLGFQIQDIVTDESQESSS